MNFAPTFVTLKYQFRQGFVFSFRFYNGVDGFAFIIWRYDNSTVWAWKVSGALNFGYVNLKD